MQFFLQTAAGVRFQSTMDRIHPYLYGVVIIPILVGIGFLYRLGEALLEVRSAQRRLVDILPLIVVTVVWNSIVVSGAWNGAVTPLVYRWLVIHGQPTVGDVTRVSLGRQTCLIAYSFCPKGDSPVNGSMVVRRKLWEEIAAPNAKITILYYQGNPKWNVPYRCSGYKVVPARLSDSWPGRV